MIKEILIVILLILSIPVGYLIAWLCRDELVNGRNWFYAVLAAELTIGAYSIVIGNHAIIYTATFAFVVTFISLIKSFDKKWVKRKI